MTEWLLGYPDKAQASIVEAMGLAARIAHPFSREYAFRSSVVDHLRGGADGGVPPLVIAAALRRAAGIDPVCHRGAVSGGGAVCEGGAVTRSSIHARRRGGGRPKGHARDPLGSPPARTRSRIGAITVMPWWR